MHQNMSKQIGTHCQIKQIQIFNIAPRIRVQNLKTIRYFFRGSIANRNPSKSIFRVPKNCLGLSNKEEATRPRYCFSTVFWLKNGTSTISRIHNAPSQFNFECHQSVDFPKAYGVRSKFYNWAFLPFFKPPLETSLHHIKSTQNSSIIIHN